MKKFWSDFKAFITRGNIIDLAVAVVIGGAFGKIVTSLVNDIIMPLITLIGGGASVSELFWKVAGAEIHYGNFLQTIIDFLIIAFFIFLALRILMNAQKQLGKLGDEIKDTTNKERNAFIKQCKAEGMNRAQIKTALAEKEAQDAADAKAKAEADAAEKKAAEEKAASETTEALLKQIRDLLLAGKGAADEKTGDSKQD